MKFIYIIFFSIFGVSGASYASNAGFSRVIISTSTISIATGFVSGTYFITLTGLANATYNCQTQFNVTDVMGPQIPPTCNFQEGASGTTPVSITTNASGYGMSTLLNFNSSDAGAALPGPTCPANTIPSHMYYMSSVGICSTTISGSLAWTSSVDTGLAELIWL